MKKILNLKKKRIYKVNKRMITYKSQIKRLKIYKRNKNYQKHYLKKNKLINLIKINLNKQKNCY